MRSLTVLLFLLVSAAPLSAQSVFTYTPAETCGANRVPILILGTYHMSNPGLDATKMEADDVLAPKRQQELADLAAHLAEFKATKIAIEGEYRDDAWTSRYQKYRQGTYELGHNEIEQIGFRLAKILGHKEVYPVDFPMMMSGLLYSEIDFNAGKKPAAPNAAPAKPAPPTEEEQLLRASTVSQYLAHLNDDARVMKGNESYMEMLRPRDNPVLYESADLVSNWYKRNLRIWANVYRISDVSKDRVLLIMGAGHLRILRQFASDSPQFCLADPKPYLR